MKMKIVIALLFVAFGCTVTDKTEFPKEALDEKMINLEGETILFKEIISQYKGKTVVIDVWASWCSDCIKGMPKVKALQHNEDAQDVAYLFLSLDRKQDAWKKGIKKYKVTGGDHYFVPSGMKGTFGKAIDLDWIPRYMVIGKDGKIKLYNAIEADDKKIIKAIKADK